MLGKYKSIDSAVDLCHAIDILENHRFYIAPVTSLNDPFEGRGSKIRIPSYAGISLALNADQLPGQISQSLNRMGALCLTSDCRNPLMWVHYANGFKGMCICVNHNGSFAEAKEVEYTDQTRVVDLAKPIDTPSKLDEAMRKALLVKHNGWSYEKEYRIVRIQCDLDACHYHPFDRDELIAVILGHCADDSVKACIRGICTRLGIPLYTTSIRDMSSKVEIVPDGFRACQDSSLFDDQLKRYCSEHDVKAFTEFEDE